MTWYYVVNKSAKVSKLLSAATTPLRTNSLISNTPTLQQMLKDTLTFLFPVYICCPCPGYVRGHSECW